MKKAILILLPLFFFSSLMTHAQIITTFAGNGTFGFIGDGGPATAAEFVNDYCAAFDGAGNVFITDAYNARVRKVNRAGIISTFAGNGTGGYTGDGGTATAAELSVPFGVAADGSGNVYIAEQGNVVRKVNAAGIISTVAGNGTAGFSGDGGPATGAKLNGPTAVVLDAAGNVYIADANNFCVRKVDAAGKINTIAGTGGVGGYSLDGAAATASALSSLADVAVDGAGNVYITDASRIRKVDPAGIMTTVAGNGTTGFSGDGGPAIAAELSDPAGVVVDGSGNMYISDWGNNRIRKVNTSGIISTIAGTGAAGYFGDGGLATAAELHQAYEIRLDCGGNLYVPDAANERMRVITYNHAPLFIRGDSLNLLVCNATVTSVDSLLSALDIDTLQTASWSVVSVPKHGTAGIVYSATTNRDTLDPTGLTYTATPGYSGNDTFRVAVTDCGFLADTATIYVVVTPTAGTITGPTVICPGGKYVDTVKGGVWGLTDTAIGDISASGVVLSRIKFASIGWDTITYTITNSCGSAIAKFPFFWECEKVNTVANALPGLQVYPNPNEGAFTVNLLSSFDEPVTIIVTNMVGEKVKEIVAVTNSAVDVRLNVTAGVYLLSGTTAHGKYVAKVTVD